MNSISNLFDSLIKDDLSQFRLLQLIGWSGYAFFIYLGAWLFEKFDPVHALYVLMATLIGFLISLIIHKSFKLIWESPPVKKFLLSLLSVCVATAFWSGWKLYVALNIFKHVEAGKLLTEYIYWYSYSFFIYLSWAGLYYGIKYYKLVHLEKEKTLRAVSMAHQAQLKMLRYQLNPHFLFNTLNSISTLILENSGKTANRMVSELSKFLRYSLDNDPMQKVSLAQEVEAMKLYLDIEKIRFNERLHLEIDIEENANRTLIPSMLLQPLVENAIKYAIAQSETGGTIRLAAKVFADELFLELSDDGPGIESVNGELKQCDGVGLTNTRERLRALYGENQSCKFNNIEPHGLKICIRLPYETEQSDSEWRN